LAAISTGISATVSINFATPQAIGIIHLQNLVTDPGATMAVTAGPYSSGIVSAWAADEVGTYDPLEWAALGRPRFFVPPNSAVLASNISISIAATTGTIALGYVGACTIWQAPVNMSFGWSITVEDLSNIQRIPFGSTFVTKYGKVRRANLGVDFLRQNGIYGEGQDDQVFSQPLAVALIAGKSSPIVVVPFPDDTGNLSRTSIWGLSSTDQQFSNPFFATWNTTFQVDQLI